MNPQLELHLENFYEDGLDRLDGDDDGLNSIQHDASSNETPHNDEQNKNNPHPMTAHGSIAEKDSKPLTMVGNRMAPIPLLGFVLLAAAEWKQVLQLHLQLRIGATTSLSIPGTVILMCLALGFVAMQPQPKQKHFLQHDLPSAVGTKSASNHPAENNQQDGRQTSIATTKKGEELRQSIDQEWKKQQHDCRCYLSKVLGSIGAPLMRSNDEQDQNTTTNFHESKGTSLDDTAALESNGAKKNPTDWCTSLMQLATAHAELIQTLDTAMEILKMGTALHLGATVTTAERVERALFGRHKRRLQQRQDQQPSVSATRTKSTTEESDQTPPLPVSFPTIRGLVTDTMFHQVRSLVVFAAHSSENVDATTSPNETPPSIVTVEDVLGAVPPVVTLTWLRESRQQLAALLSYVLEELSTTSSLVSQQSHANDDDAQDKSVDRLKQSIRVAEELQLHILHALGVEDNHQTKDNQKSLGALEGPPILKRHLTKVRTQYRKLFMALWAMEDAVGSTTQQGEESSVSNLEIKDWWARVNRLHDDVCASLQELDRDVFQEQEDLAASNGNEEADDAVSQKRSDGVQSYTVETSSRPEVQKSAAAKPTKTAVFSGKGAIQPHPKRQKNASTPLSKTDQQSSNAGRQNDPVAQHFLLNELRTRLQTLSLPEEEHEVDEDAQEKVPTVGRPNSSTKKTTAIPLFGGVAGSLLVGELKNTVNQLGGQDLGDDDISAGNEEES